MSSRSNGCCLSKPTHELLASVSCGLLDSTLESGGKGYAPDRLLDALWLRRCTRPCKFKRSHELLMLPNTSTKAAAHEAVDELLWRGLSPPQLLIQREAGAQTHAREVSCPLVPQTSCFASRVRLRGKCCGSSCWRRSLSVKCDHTTETTCAAKERISATS